MATTTVAVLADLSPLVGTELGTSSWVEVDQNRIDTFAAATDDRQWIHVDPVRAAAGPFGTTIAHGFLTLSLVIPMWSELLEVESVTTKVNYGLGKVRFPAPVPVGSQLRLSSVLNALEPLPAGGSQITAGFTVERDGSPKPVCVGELVVRFYE